MRWPMRSHALIAVLLAVPVGCAPEDTEAEDAVQTRLEALEDSISALTEALGASVDLKPGDASFSLLRLDVGSLALVFDTLEPYGAGSRVGLNVGNLTSAQIDEINATVWWGILQADGTHAVAEQRSRSLTLTQALPPGAWTRVSFALDSVPPDQIRFLRISNASATSIRLP